MNRRVQRALDGELPVERLSAAEREEFAACQAAMAQVLAELAEPEPAPDLTGAVMWRITHPPAEAYTPSPRRTALSPVLRQTLLWLWRPRAIQLRPAAVLATLALVLAGAFGYERARTPAAPLVDFASQPRLLVQFRLGAEGARDVALMGDFSGWETRYELEEVAPGVWSTTVPLEPGVYDYAFVVDGNTWTLDPLAPSVSDGFGGANSRLSVLAPELSTRT